MPSAESRVQGLCRAGAVNLEAVSQWEVDKAINLDETSDVQGDKE